MNPCQALWEHGGDAWHFTNDMLTHRPSSSSFRCVYGISDDRPMVHFSNNQRLLARFPSDGLHPWEDLKARCNPQYRQLFAVAIRVFQGWVLQHERPKGQWYWSSYSDAHFHHVESQTGEPHVFLEDALQAIFALSVFPSQKLHTTSYDFSRPLRPRDNVIFVVPDSSHQKLEILRSYERDVKVLERFLQTPLAQQTLERLAKEEF